MTKRPDGGTDPEDNPHLEGMGSPFVAAAIAIILQIF